MRNLVGVFFLLYPCLCLGINVMPTPEAGLKITEESYIQARYQYYRLVHAAVATAENVLNHKASRQTLTTYTEALAKGGSIIAKMEVEAREKGIKLPEIKKVQLSNGNIRYYDLPDLRSPGYLGDVTFTPGTEEANLIEEINKLHRQIVSLNMYIYELDENLLMLIDVELGTALSRDIEKTRNLSRNMPIEERRRETVMYLSKHKESMAQLAALHQEQQRIVEKLAALGIVITLKRIP